MASDFYFGFRLGQQKRPFYFVNKSTAKIRLTKLFQSRHGGADNAFRSFKILMEDLQLAQITPEIEKSLSGRVPGAIFYAPRTGTGPWPGSGIFPGTTGGLFSPQVD